MLSACPPGRGRQIHSQITQIPFFRWTVSLPVPLLSTDLKSKRSKSDKKHFVNSEKPGWRKNAKNGIFIFKYQAPPDRPAIINFVN